MEDKQKTAEAKDPTNEAPIVIDSRSETPITIEPVRKKSKLRETLDDFMVNLVESKEPLQAIVSDDLSQPLPLIKVYVGMVRDIKTLSEIVTTLNEKIPVKELSHLKRVYRKEVLLFPVTYPKHETHKSLKKYLEKHANELLEYFEYYRTIEVPSVSPKLKKQYHEWCRTWSVNFHVDNYLERLVSPECFTELQLRSHRLFMGMAFEVAKYYLSKEKSDLEPVDVIGEDLNATVVVEPRSKSVVAIAFDNRKEHPTQHSAMIAIDNVAKTQRGGVWNPNSEDPVNLRGIDKDVLAYLKARFPTVKFGAKDYVTKEEMENMKKTVNCPYLCTGYYVYLIREPCLMCAMGLVHARTNRVFFCMKHELGALGSKTKLQCIPALNHHFEVFTDFLNL
ncbi:putative inactive tRNA-specific adenosine deaminase-like protein 3 [Anticarsia gemmatalis]|uniref:putative inactive tRNA-specific adenosine deaminase-like protein 3 n=1 Tax=Anticarsia gemmatalis TaxID=129554 RepID=UPI003F7584AA